MQRRATLIGIVSSLVLTMGIAQADVTTFDNLIDDKWSTAGNWDNGIPDATDRAVIPINETCHVDITNAVADTVDVQGTLIIDLNKKLTLDNSSDDNTANDPDNSIVDDTLRLAGSGSVLAFIDNDHGVTGDGKIRGLNNAARIDIDADIEFRSRLNNTRGGVRGALVIKGLTGGTNNGKFINDGRVVADVGGGTLHLHADTLLDDHSTIHAATWTFGDVLRATLLFSGDAVLSGDIIQECSSARSGILRIDADVDTCGKWTFDARQTVVTSGSTFRYATYAGLVTNPGTPTRGPCSIAWSLTNYDSGTVICP